MADNFGLKIGVEGEKEFKSALYSINQSFKVLGSEMKLVESQFSKNDTSIQSLTAKNQVLNKEIDTQKQKIELLKNALNNSSESFGENDKRTQEWQIKLNNATAELNSMEKELKTNEAALDSAGTEMDDVSKSADKMGNDIDDAGNKAENSNGKFEKLGSVLKGIGATMGAVAVAAGAAAVALASKVVSAYAEFEQLEGGVKTLFGTEASSVEEYAASVGKSVGEVEGKYKKTFELVKLKEYDGNNENEKVFFEGLFKKKNNDNKENIDGVVTESDLKNKFYKTINKILSNINTLNNRCKLFEISADNKTIYVIFMIIISLLTVIAVPMFDYSDLNNFISSIIISFCCVSVFKILNFRQLSLVFRIIYGFIFFSTFTIFLITNFITGSLEFLYLISVIIGNICIIGMLLCLKYMPKRTKYGTQILGKIKGFKIFLETAEKEKLESMVFNEPNYFYNILPYAYVLGISEKWIKKFETISLNSPHWYIGTTNFNLNYFVSFVNKTMTSIGSTKWSNSSSNTE